MGGVEEVSHSANRLCKAYHSGEACGAAVGNSDGGCDAYTWGMRTVLPVVCRGIHVERCHWQHMGCLPDCERHLLGADAGGVCPAAKANSRPGVAIPHTIVSSPQIT